MMKAHPAPTDLPKGSVARRVQIKVLGVPGLESESGMELMEVR